MSIDASISRNAQNGRDVVLLHPFPFDHRVWQDVANELVTLTECAIVIPDYRGCGESSLGDEAPDLALVAHDIWQGLDQLGMSRPHLIGNSLGGYVAMAMLRERPQAVAGIGLVGSKITADSDEVKVNRERLASQIVQRNQLEVFADNMIQTVVGKHTKVEHPDVVEMVYNWMMQSSPETIAWLSRGMALRPDSSAELKAFDGPVLLVRGEQDEFSTVADFDHMQLHAPHSTIHTIKNCGHLPPVEAMQATAVAIRDWLNPN